MRAFAFMCLLAAGSACADDLDENALSLADKASFSAAPASDWKVFVEGAVGESIQRIGSTPIDTQRFSLDVQYDKFFSPGWRAIFADRLDMGWQNRFDNENKINTLKEAYLSWQHQNDRIIDIGRINVRYGVATGYNPTDFFRANAVRSVVSIDPNSLRRNRLGSVMLRGQQLWSGGSLTALYSPKLADQPSDGALSIDLGATNHQNRWLLAASQQISDNLNPQWLIYGAEHQSPQFGVNLTTLLNDATVAYVEWSGGRSPSLLSQVLNGADDSAFRSRLSTGLTYTTKNKVSATLEYEYNGAALDREEWNALGRRSVTDYTRYRVFLANLQEIPTKHALFLYSTWQDAVVSHLDLSAMMRWNAIDHSCLSWLEARYHWHHTDLSVQWQLNTGSRGSEFGTLPQRRNLQVLLTYFF
jgi:hypothetical protein